MIFYVMPDYSLRFAAPASQDGPALHQMRSMEVHPEPLPAFRKLRSCRPEGTCYIVQDLMISCTGARSCTCGIVITRGVKSKYRPARSRREAAAPRSDAAIEC